MPFFVSNVSTFLKKTPEDEILLYNLLPKHLCHLDKACVGEFKGPSVSRL